MPEEPAGQSREGSIVHDDAGAWTVRHYGEDYVFLVGADDGEDPDDRLTMARVIRRPLFDALTWREPLDEQVTYYLERVVEGEWMPFTAHKADPAEVVRTYDFAVQQDSDEEVRIAEVRVGVALISRSDVLKRVPAPQEG